MKPKIVQICGLLLTKFVVPSMGSMIQVLLSVRTHFSPAATLSSPMKLVSGYFSFSPLINMASTAWSVSVTRSFGALFSLKYFIRFREKISILDILYLTLSCSDTKRHLVLVGILEE